MRRLVLFVLVLFCLSTSVSFAQGYIGRYCLYLENGEKVEENQIAITAIDEINYSVNGTSTSTSSSDIGSVVGNAAIVGDGLVITVNKSVLSNEKVSTSTSSVKLSLSSLEGTYKTLGQDDSGGSRQATYSSGNAKLSACNSSVKTKCELNGGSWSDQYSECTGISEAFCQELGGHYESCGSVCRHAPPGTICVMMCDVEYCAF